MKILVTDDEQEIRELVALFLESHFNATIVEASSGNQAIEILKTTQDIDCVVCDYSMRDGTGGDVFKYLRSIGSKIPFILCTAYDQRQLLSVFPVTEVAGFLLKPNILKPLQATIESLNLEEGPAVAEAGVEFSPIRIGSIAQIGGIPFDLHIMLSAGKFVKLSRAGDAFTREDIRKYQAKGVDFLYLRRGDLTGLMSTLTQRMEKLCDDALTSDKEIHQFSISAVEVVNSLNPLLPFPEEAQQLLKTSAKLAMKTIHLNRRLHEIFRELIFHPNIRYIPAHSVAVGHLACLIASQMGWNSDTTFHKLLLASLVHDITLRNDEVAEVPSLAELTLNAERFSQEDMDAFIRHPEEVAALLMQMKEIPPEVHQIVIQHHERPDGSGFPKRLEHLKIDPLSAVFIVAEELYRYYRAHGTPKRIQDFVAELGPSFGKGTFGQIIATMIRAENR